MIPFFSFLVCTVLGGAKLLSEKGIRIFIILCMFACWLITFITFIQVINSEEFFNLPLSRWFNLKSLNIIWGININSVTITMLLLIVSISSLVHIYSLNYMGGEPHLSRFMGYLGLFTTFMIILVTSPNLVQMFIGWEGVGVCSYLLINFWSSRVLASQSAFKAMAVNKIGDLAFLLAMGLIINEVGTLNLSIINSIFAISTTNTNYILIGILLLTAVTGKSAQVGLHMWLPDAMEGPTPVSALIHAATMVTAGVFLVIKLSPFFFNSNIINIIIMILGSFTCFMAASIGCAQTDLKKIIAYSTCSQLGYMILVCGYGYYNVGLFHLFNHGVFKALLFLSAGLVIHSLMNEQSILKMGLNNSGMIGKYGLYMGSLAITGFPFLTGYYSKDLLLELLAAKYTLIFPLWLGYISASLTCFYSLKSIYLSYSSKYNYSFLTKINQHENNILLITPIFILGLGSVIIGYLASSSILNPNKPVMISNFTKVLPIIIALFVILLTVDVKTYIKNLKLSKVNSVSKIIKVWITSLTSANWFFNELINRGLLVFIKPSFNYSYKLIDGQLLEKAFPNGLRKKSIQYTINISNFSIRYIPLQLKVIIWFMLIIFILT